MCTPTGAGTRDTCHVCGQWTWLWVGQGICVSVCVSVYMHFFVPLCVYLLVSVHLCVCVCAHACPTLDLFRSERTHPGRQVKALVGRHPAGITTHLSFFIRF